MVRAVIANIGEVLVLIMEGLQFGVPRKMWQKNMIELIILCLLNPMPDNWKPETLNAIAAIGSVIVAFCALIVSAVAVFYARETAIHHNLSTSASLLTTMSLAYDSPELRKKRKVFAAKLLNPKTRKDFDICDNESVLDFFEEIAYHTKRGVLDKGMVWNHLFWHIERYYTAVVREPNLIELARTDNESPFLYIEIEWLLQELIPFREAELNGKKYAYPTDNQILEFLKHESDLSVNPDLEIGLNALGEKRSRKSSKTPPVGK